MITTNGRENKPSAAKGTCPSAGNWIHAQLPIPDCGPDSSFVPLSDTEGGRAQAHPIPALQSLGWRPPNLNPFRGSCARRLQSSPLDLGSESPPKLLYVNHCFVPIA